MKASNLLVIALIVAIIAFYEIIAERGEAQLEAYKECLKVKCGGCTLGPVEASD